jgi:MYXO-CTERM domain-containing protein
MDGVDTAFNSWDLKLTPADKDFASTSDPSVSGTGVSVEESGALGPRQPDGSLPAVDFLKLAAASQMIDKGTDVGLPFAGAAPDLGAYEFGAVAGIDGGVPGKGGATGTGGRSGGAVGTGGRNGGAVGTGGRSGAGGIIAAGGRTGNGGAIATGGRAGNGGVVSGKGGDTAGAPGAGGMSSVAGSGGTSASAGTTGGGTAASGCSCRLSRDAGTGIPALFILALLALRRRRRG